MKEFSIEELEKIINEGIFNSLIGKIENDFFDCKKEIYDLKNDSSKRELAKDVSSFANLCGGYILIGLQTRKSKNHFGDEIERKNLLNQGLVDISQYFNVIRDWIYPEIEGLKIEWKPNNNDESKGILVIQVPRQKETSKPFLIKKVVERKKHSEITFGYVERKGDNNDPKKIEDIHKIMRDGLLYDRNIENRFDALESLIEINQQQLQKDKSIRKDKETEEMVKEKTDATLKVNNINNQRAIILTTYPKDSKGELKTLFTERADTIKRKLEDPPTTIRRDGWSLETLDRGKIIEGQLVRVMDGDRVIDLYKDGMLIFAGLANEQFLAWSSKDELKINSLALIELVYNFISFYKEVINDLNEQPNMISVKFAFINMWLNDKRSYLTPGPIGTLFTSRYNAPRNEYFSESIDFDAKSFDIGKIAYKIIEGIYLWFGIPLNNRNIPYTKKLENSSIIIDVDQIKNLR